MKNEGGLEAPCVIPHFSSFILHSSFFILHCDVRPQFSRTLMSRDTPGSSIVTP
jgi:hypothetical protein